MHNFKIIKTSNDIEDLCITFGVVALIKHIGEDVLNISDKGSFYNIKTEEFDLSDVSEIGYQFEKEDTGEYKLDIFRSCTPMMNKSEVTGNAAKIELFIKSFGEKTLKYLLNLKDEDSKEIKKEDTALFCGNTFYSYGTRLNARLNTAKISKYKKWLSLLGWMCYVNKIEILKKGTGKAEKTMYLIPRVRETEQLDRVSWFYTSKEGEIKEIKVVSEESVRTSLAKMNLSQLEYEASSEGYYGYYLITMTPTANKPMSDKFLEINFLDKNISSDTREYFKRKFMNQDIREDLATYILNRKRYSNLSNLIKVMSKKDVYQKDGKTKISYIDKQISREMISMQNKDVVKIYTNETIKKLGNGLNRLLGDSKGYEVQVKLLNARKADKVMTAIKELVSEYKKTYVSKAGHKASLISEEDTIQFFELLNSDDKKIAKVLADAVIFNSKIFMKFEKEGANSIEKENKLNKEGVE